MRFLQFEQIADNRFKGQADTINALANRRNAIVRALRVIPGVTVDWDNMRRYDWPDGSTQFRQTYRIFKEGRGATWQTIMEIVDAVKAPHYEFKTI